KHPPIKEIEPGIFEIGKVRFNKESRTISFPAEINMTNGPVEYLLVTAVGKLHESVLRTDVEPMHIHVAALLLGAKGAQTNLTVQAFNTREIPGEKVQLFIETTEKPAKIPAEQLVFNTKESKIMTKGPWVYNGSQLHGGTFIAQRDGLVISIMTDPLALINNPRPGRENDEIWQVHTPNTPPLNSAVQFHIIFQQKEKE
ncbi:MAG: YdjY domain-containing protein, partial [Limisphaerales bacterium]